jgi:hypothetical protein
MKMSNTNLIIPVMVNQPNGSVENVISFELDFDPALNRYNVSLTEEFINDILESFKTGFLTIDPTRSIEFKSTEESKPVTIVKPDIDILNYVGYQEIPVKSGDDANVGMIFYLTVNTADNNMSIMPISIEKTVVKCTLTESEMIEQVKSIFAEWPEWVIPKYTDKEFKWEKYKQKIGTLPLPQFVKLPTGLLLTTRSIDIVIPWFKKYNARERYNTWNNIRVMNNIARQTRRGMGNTQYNNTSFYKGSSEFDCPVIVVKKGELYSVFKHPNFTQYGYNVKYD